MNPLYTLTWFLSEFNDIHKCHQKHGSYMQTEVEKTLCSYLAH